MVEKLVLFGGEKAISGGLERCQRPIVPDKAYKTINDMLIKGDISASPVVYNFERRFANYIGVEYGLCYVNGTTSIQAALFAVGVGAGDEVIVPSFTFWATVGPVAAANAIPVFADVDRDTHLLTAETIEKCITPRTKAILLVHVWGNPCDMDSIMEVAKKYNLKVIEDCSHAHGASYKGKKVGSFGDIGCFSLQASKVLPGGEGGILVTNNREYFERACALGHYERLGGLPDDSEYKQYSLTGFGFKHRINPLTAAIADAGLDRLDELNAIRRENGEYFDKCLAELGHIKPLKEVEGGHRVYSYHHIEYLPEKLKGLSMHTFLEALTAEGAFTGPCGYGMLHKAPFFAVDGPYSKNCHFGCPHYEGKYAPAEYLEVSEHLNKTVIYAAPRFEYKDKSVIDEYVHSHKKVIDNLDLLLKYDNEKSEKEKQLKSDGRSITTFRK